MCTFEDISNLSQIMQKDILKDHGLFVSQNPYENEAVIARLYHSQNMLDIIDSAYLQVTEFGELYSLSNEDLIKMGNDIGFVFPMVPRNVNIHAILVRGVIYNLMLKKGTPLYLGPKITAKRR